MRRDGFGGDGMAEEIGRARGRRARQRTAGRGLRGLVALVLVTGGAGLAGTSAGEDGATRPAQHATGFARPGIYLAFAAGGLIETFDAPDALLEGLTQAAYVGGKIGSRHNRWIATETSVDYAVRGFEQDGALFGEPGLTAEVRPLYLSGNLKLYVLDGRFQPYVAGGVGGAWAFVDVSGALNGSETFGSFLGRVGGGLDVYLTENLAVSPEIYWNITTGDLEALRTLSIGANVLFRF